MSVLEMAKIGLSKFLCEPLCKVLLNIYSVNSFNIHMWTLILEHITKECFDSSNLKVRPRYSSLGFQYQNLMFNHFSSQQWQVISTVVQLYS